MLRTILNYINDNKDWIFSGVGMSLILLMVAIMRYLSRRERDSRESERVATTELPPESPPTEDHQGIKVFLNRLPQTDPDLFGRDDELKMLDEAWQDPETNVISLVAWGGVGKTSLVNRWLVHMGGDKYRGAEMVYGWSFYRQPSADIFIAAALGWFGDPTPDAGGPWDKIDRLAHYIRERRTLLILDGLEPLQYRPTEMEGRPKDQAFGGLLRELALYNPGLCIITTRWEVGNLTAQQPVLEHLSPKAGARLLSRFGVKGPQKELEEASEEFDGHALALTLLGGLLRDQYGGDVRCWREIDPLEEDIQKGGHARRVMESYERWLGEGPELSILRLLGLFDRPAEAGALAVLRQAPVLPGLTDALFHGEEQHSPLSDRDWDRAVTKLRYARLLLEKEPRHPDTLDAHPLIREHFSEKLKESNPDAWKEANSRLYEYYQSQAEEYPDTVEEMAFLYTAVAHGCMADRHLEVWNKVYELRIQRRGGPDEKEFYSTYVLGTFGNEIAALSNFFSLGWDKLVEGLGPSAGPQIMRTTGVCLRALGRFSDAVKVLTRAFDQNKEKQNWEEAAVDAGILMHSYLLMGKIIDAKNCIEHGVHLADKGGDELEKIRKRIELAWVLFKMGDMISAEELFKEAWEMEKADLMEQDVKYSYSVFRYCEFLLSKEHYEEALSCAHKAIKIEKKYPSTSAKALNALILGRVACMKGASNAIVFLNKAVEACRKSHRRENLTFGLLARAELHRKTENFEKARQDLDGVMDIATQSEMRLYEADCHLGYARLYLAMGNKEKARENLDDAKEMIDDMGYHRRDGEVTELEKTISLLMWN